VLWKSGREQRSREIRDVVVVCFSACQFKPVIWQATGRGTLFGHQVSPHHVTHSPDFIHKIHFKVESLRARSKFHIKNSSKTRFG
jgi:hypothetical protein